MAASKSEIDAQIARGLAGTGAPLTSRQAAFIKLVIESRSGGNVDVGQLSNLGGHSVKITDPASGFFESYGVSKYGITPGEIRFGSKHKGGDKFMALVRATINKAKKLR